jgi:DNA-binding beta-propeller fold protein YncE
VQILDHIKDSALEDTPFVPAETSNNYRSPIDVVGSYLTGNVYVADETNNTVEVIRTISGVLVNELTVSQKPNTLLLSADGKYLYVATGGAKGKVEVFNTETNLYAGSVSVGHTPSALALSEDGNTLYVANRFNGTVQTVALTNGAIAAGTEASEGVFVTREPMSMAINGNKLYVGGHLPTGTMDDDTVSSEVVVVDTATMKVAKTITMVSGSTNLKDIALSPDGEYLYVSHALGRWNVATTHVDRGWIYTNAITEIRTSDDTVRATMLVDDLDWGAGNPWGIDVTDDIVVVSNDFHLARVRMLFKRVAGGDYHLNTLAAPTSHLPSRIKMYIREPLALIKSFLCDGW